MEETDISDTTVSISKMDIVVFKIYLFISFIYNNKVVIATYFSAFLS